jgi:hypothetical protein
MMKLKTRWSTSRSDPWTSERHDLRARCFNLLKII